MRGRVLLFLMLVALAAAAPRASAQAAPASPAPAAQEARDANAATRAAFEEAERLIDAGRFDEARAALRGMAREDDFARVYGAFVDARLDEATGRLTRARDAYRAILNAHPELARVRLHLARTLTRLEDHEGARRHYDFVIGAPDIAAPLADRVRQDARALEGAKRWSAQAYLTFAPTTNMTSGTSQDRVQIGALDFTPAKSGQRKSGIGALYGADFAYSAPLSDDWGWIATLSTQHRDHIHRGFDDRSAQASAGFRYLLPTGVANLELASQRRWFGGADYLYAFGPQLSARLFAGERNRLTLSTSAMTQRYDSESYRDGVRLALNASWDRFTAPGQFLRIGLSAERDRARSDHLAFHEFGGLIGYNVDLPFALTLYPEAGFARRDYEGDFPLMSAPRRDRRFTASLSAVKKDLVLGGFAPRFQVSYTDNRSSVKLYQYDRLDFNITLTRAF
jgi:hypothetical protein